VCVFRTLQGSGRAWPGRGEPPEGGAGGFSRYLTVSRMVNWPSLLVPVLDMPKADNGAS